NFLSRVLFYIYLVVSWFTTRDSWSSKAPLGCRELFLPTIGFMFYFISFLSDFF
ncbi:hypothetical protein EDC04DRAFT_2765246, partial [Pisolithus marmoratus]